MCFLGCNANFHLLRVWPANFKYRKPFRWRKTSSWHSSQKGVCVWSWEKPCYVIRLGVKAGGWQAVVAGRDSRRAGREIRYGAEIAVRINTSRGLASSTGQGKPIFKPWWTNSRARDKGRSRKARQRGGGERETAAESSMELRWRGRRVPEAGSGLRGSTCGGQ